MRVLDSKRGVRVERALRSRRHGTMMLTNLVLVMVMVLLISLMFNDGHTVIRRAELQSAADAAASSAASVKERSMNAITYANTVVGGIMGLIVPHHALGGDLLDERKKAEDAAENRGELNRLNTKLELAYQGAQAAQAIDKPFERNAYATVRQESGIYAEATILEAKMRLKEYMAWCLTTMVAAEIMQAYPPTKPAGEALELAMEQFAKRIESEYKVLNEFQASAEALLALKTKLRAEVLRDIKAYTDEVVRATPVAVRSVAKRVALQNGAQDAFVSNPELPVYVDPLAEAHTLPGNAVVAATNLCDCKSVRTDVTRDQIVKVTQLARASFPWVVYHRQPVWDSLARQTPLSQAGDLYKDFSDGYSKRLCDRYQTDEYRYGLYVIRDYVGPEKGFASWTTDRRIADDVFSTMVAVSAQTPNVIGETVFGQQHPDGQLAFAQAMIYNGNEQAPNLCRIDLRCKRITPNRQANFGLDTLNFYAATPSQRPWELIAKTDSGNAPTPFFPAVRLNWQAKLVPASAEQVRGLRNSPHAPSAMRPVLDRLLDDTPGALLSH